LTVQDGLEYLLIRLNNFHTCAETTTMASRKGKKNRRTLYREHLEKVKQVNGGVDKINGTDHIGESLDIMGEAMFFLAQMARTERDPDKRGEYYRCACNIAAKLAPFRYPTYATVRVGGDRENPLLVREGVTSWQIMEELRQKIMETGLLPTKWKNGGGIIDVIPQRQSG
jgi:hypothetical protein